MCNFGLSDHNRYNCKQFWPSECNRIKLYAILAFLSAIWIKLCAILAFLSAKGRSVCNFGFYECNMDNIVCNFGLSECNRIKLYAILTFLSAIG